MPGRPSTPGTKVIVWGESFSHFNVGQLTTDTLDRLRESSFFNIQYSAPQFHITCPSAVAGCIGPAEELSTDLRLLEIVQQAAIVHRADRFSVQEILERTRVDSLSINAGASSCYILLKPSDVPLVVKVLENSKYIVEQRA